MKKAITYSLSMNSVSFEYVTVAVAIHSLEQQRLQSIGQCAPQWIERRRRGLLPQIDVRGFRAIWTLQTSERRLAKLNLSLEDATSLKELRYELHAQLHCRRSAGMALAAMAYAIVTDAQKKPNEFRLLKNI